MKKMISLLLIVCILLTFTGCKKDTDKTETWSIDDFEKYGVDNFAQPDKFTVNTFSENDNKLASYVKCKDKCTLEDVEKVVKGIYDKLVVSTNNKIYKVERDEVQNFVVKTPISSYDETLSFRSEDNYSCEYVYLYDNKYYALEVLGNVLSISINFAQIEVTK